MNPVWLVLLGIVSVQLGASFAKDLFSLVTPTGMVWLRMAAAALVVGLVARPTLRGRSRTDWLLVITFGLSLGIMNWSFYQSIARIPLGIAVSIAGFTWGMLRGQSSREGQAAIEAAEAGAPARLD